MYEKILQKNFQSEIYLVITKMTKILQKIVFQAEIYLEFTKMTKIFYNKLFSSQRFVWRSPK